MRHISHPSLSRRRDRAFSTEENRSGDRARGSRRDRGRSTRLDAADKVMKRYSMPSPRGTHKEWIPLPQDPPRVVGALPQLYHRLFVMSSPSVLRPGRARSARPQRSAGDQAIRKIKRACVTDVYMCDIRDFTRQPKGENVTYQQRAATYLRRLGENVTTTAIVRPA